ncbi:MAG: hypothetical protein M0Q12_09655 [Synergistaceae bacterium]|jgi:hypothetical protein|nr:hypothetical protein [Synergistaceae bacterium]
MADGNGFVITKDTWERTPQEQRDWIMFETIQSMNDRLKVLERWNKALSFAGGIIGGIATVIVTRFC